MATKTLRQTTPTNIYTYFNIGDTAYYLRNGVQLPVIITGIEVSSAHASNANQARYIVSADLSGNWPAGNAQGPFSHVSGNLLSSR